jgi:hypothetical protein
VGTRSDDVLRPKAETRKQTSYGVSGAPFSPRDGAFVGVIGNDGPGGELATVTEVELELAAMLLGAVGGTTGFEERRADDEEELREGLDVPPERTPPLLPRSFRGDAIPGHQAAPTTRT